MKRWLYAAGVLLTALCVWFFAARVLEHWPALRQISLQPGLIAWLLVGLLVYLATFVPSSGSWYAALRIFGQRITLFDCLRINLVSQFAKFIPGNVGQHIGRVVLATQIGASGKAATASVFLDMLALAGVGVLLSLLNIDAAFALADRHGDLLSIDRLFLSAAALAALLAVLCVLFLTFSPRHYLDQLRAALARSGENARHLSSLAAASISCHATSFVLGAVSILCIASGVHGSLDVGFLHVLGAYSLAWLAGFILPGAPAGIGVRELVMLLALGPFMGEQAATAVTALFRIVTTLGDGVAFCAGLLLPKSTPIEPNGRADA